MTVIKKKVTYRNVTKISTEINEIFVCETGTAIPTLLKNLTSKMNINTVL